MSLGPSPASCSHPRPNPDDLNDAFAALWTARRIANGTAQVFGDRAADKFGLRMEMWA
jgi:predicted RNase H-like nuclease